LKSQNFKGNFHKLNSMGTTETKISSQLRALIRLQHIDTLIYQVVKERGDLPEEIRDLEDESAGLQTRMNKIKQEQEDTEQARRRSEFDIEEAETLIKKYEEQQIQVRNNREFDALTKEIEAQRERIFEAQELISDTEGTLEESSSQIEKAQERFTELENLLAEKRTQLDEVLSTTEKQMSDLEGLRKEAESMVDERYLRAYQRLRNRYRDGRAVVRLHRGAAGGFAVPPQRQMEIRQRNRIIPCEQTGRIIVDSEFYEEATSDLTI